MSWLDDTGLRDLDEHQVIEATCMRCLFVWKQSPTQLLIKVDHRDVRLSEVGEHLPCKRFGCDHIGAKITVIRNRRNESFVGGMP